ncbi:MAG: alkaline phosphatase family protein [Elusimicrobia bacterium]|nr:alkaline phosphatase family protein [Elusimicrobiota bacterium]
MNRLLILALVWTGPAFAAGPAENVLYVTTDGMRWQEIFGGANDERMDLQDAYLKERFWRDTPEERRRAMMPFLWDVVAKQGQLWGNQKAGSVAQVTNGKKFSYPGYQELLTGFPDASIDSNDKKPNPNVSVLEWLNGRPGLQGKVAAVGTWDVLPFILNRERSKLPILAAEEPIREKDLTEREKAINDLRRDTALIWRDNPFDSFTHHSALAYLKRHKPRVLYIQFGETDEFAHENKYGDYLLAARRVDGFLKELWETVQSMKEYKGKTTLIVSTDHGRGNGPKWTEHWAEIDGAENIWIAAMGPGVAGLGERKNAERVTQSQIAATVAALVGEDYNKAQPKAGLPLPIAR